MRNSILDFLIKEISQLTNKNPQEIKYKCDAIIKSALANKNKIRIALFKNEIVGILFLGRNSIQTLIATGDWKSAGVYKWLIDFSKERYRENLTLYYFENDLNLEEIALQKDGKLQGAAQHPGLNFNLKKIIFV